MFSFSADDILAYDTVKIVRIKDWRVGTLHYTFVCVIFCYVIVYQLYFLEGYKHTATPNGYIRLETDWPSKSTPVVNLPYCLQDGEVDGKALMSLKDTSSKGFKHTCVYMESVEAVQPRGQGWLTVSTRITMANETRTTDWTQQTDKMWQHNSPPRTFYVADSEHASIWVDHAAMSAAIDLYGSSRFSRGKLVDINGNVVKELDGVKDVITLKEFLSATGNPELDVLTDSVLHKGSTRREVGAVVVCMIEYTNIMTGGELTYKLKPQMLPGVNFRQDQIHWTTYPNSRARWERYGIRIVFIPGGTVGTFVFQQALINLVTGLALLALSTAVVDFIATRVLPAREVYFDCKYAPVEVMYDEDDDGIFGHAQKVETENNHIARHDENANDGTENDGLLPEQTTSSSVKAEDGDTLK